MEVSAKESLEQLKKKEKLWPLEKNVISDFLKSAEQQGIKFFTMQFTDVTGRIKTMTITSSQLETALEQGIVFDGSAIEGFARKYESELLLKPDLATFAILPWLTDSKVGRFICDVYDHSGKRFEGDPRYILEKSIANAASLGMQLSCGIDFEYFIFKANGDNRESILHDTASLFDTTPKDIISEARRRLMNYLEAVNIPVTGAYHETGPNQHGVGLLQANTLKVADNILALKHTIKATAKEFGLLSTFMPKPLKGISGSGLHIMQKLYNLENNQNAFYDRYDQYNLSEEARYFMAGQLSHIKALCAIAAPTVNSYKRFVPTAEAPCYVAWARTNHSVPIRVPAFEKSNPDSALIEFRLADPTCNPYLTLAVALESGLDGLKNKLPLPDAIEEDVYEFTEQQLEDMGVEPLPRALIDALCELENDEVVKNSLGQYALSKFLKAKKTEWNEYRTNVSKWEWERYFDII